MSLLPTVLLASLCGCAVIPATRTQTRSLGLRDGAIVEGADHGLALACARQIIDVTEVTHSRELAFHTPDDPRAQVFGALVAPVVVPVSFLVSFATVALRDDEVTQELRLDHTVAMTCTRPAAGEPIELELASGVTLHLIADREGVVSMTLLETEPSRGKIVGRAGTAETHVTYALPAPAEVAARDAIRMCAAEHAVSGTLRAEITVDEAGLPRHLHLDRSMPALTSCIASAVASLRFPDGQRATTVVVPVELPPS